MPIMPASTGKGDRAEADDAGQHWKSGWRRC